METIERTCTVCGSDIEIAVAENGTYEGAHYLGTFDIPADDAEVVDRYESDVIEDVEVVEHSEYDEIELWECDGCYSRLKRTSKNC